MKIRSKNRILQKAYKRQVKNSKSRGHKPPNYNRFEFIEWCLNSPIFHLLYSKWVKSGCKKDLIPSIDRLDDSIGYSFSNIRITTWKENREKEYSNPNNIIHKKTAVTSYDLDGNKIKDYGSVKDARLDTGARNIVSVCKGKRKKSGNLIWKYTNNYGKNWNSNRS